MSCALLFSGQGAQHPQMMPWVDGDDALLRQMQAALGVTDWRQSMSDVSWASRNRNVQLLLTGVALSAWARLSAHLPAPAAVAGYSVGELAAFSAAGVIDAPTAIDLAATRAEAMDRAAAAAPGGMLGVTGLGPRAIDALCADTGLSIAIRIDVDAVVLGGPVDALAHAERIATAGNAKCSRLPIEVASHTPSMAGAAAAFEAALRAVRMQAPKVALFTNAADRVHTAEAASQALSRQIAQTVEWAHCLDGIHARQPSCVLEIGPGAALAAMWNRRHPDVPARSADEFRRADAVVDWVRRHVDR